MLFVPVFLFYLLQYFFYQNVVNSKLLLLMIFVPLALSFSIGVIGCLLFSGLITFFVYFQRLAPKRRIVNSLITITAVCCVVFFILFFFYRDNPLFLRLENIFTGGDTSGKGRTENAFILATDILNEKNKYWGIGPGQLKFVGGDIIRSYYLYTDNNPVAIPNAAAETLLLFGWIGFSLRLLLLVFLFFYKKVWANYFRLLLFLFMFIYQFTGSYITNPAEYVIWVLAFTNVFPDFNVKKREYQYSE
jgi:hypothetical protein